MGLLGKLMFWKKEPEMPDFGKDFDMGGMEGPDLALPKEDDLGMPAGMMGSEPGAVPPGGPVPGGPGQMPGAEPGGPSATFSAPKLEEVPMSRQQQPQYQGSMQSGAGSKDMELISVKIDQIRTSMDILNQRVMHIERLIEESNKPKW